MPVSNTWPGGVALESMSIMDSAGSCDSVISVNSGCSEDSMEYLSAEERACLMFLEETIEALEVQEDSGLSNDEPDPKPTTEMTDQKRVDEISGLNSESGRDEETSLSCGVAMPNLIAEPGSTVLTTENKAEDPALNQTPEPQSTPAPNETSVNLMTQPMLPMTESVPVCNNSTSDDQTKLLSVSPDGDGDPVSCSTNTSPCISSEMDLGLIPPPLDFMDEPDPLPQPEKVKEPPRFSGTSGKRPAVSVDLEQLRQRASLKRSSVNSPVTQKRENMPAVEVPASPAAVASSPQMNLPTSPDTAEPRSPPAVAPKPKKLPSNIILKSHKASAPNSDGNLVLSPTSNSEWLPGDPQRIRFEALRKLGLIKSDDTDSGPTVSPKMSPQSPRSWATPPSPSSPLVPHKPTTTLSYINSPPVASMPSSTLAAASPSGPPAAPAVLPAPTAFCDRLAPELSAVKDVPVKPQMRMPLTPPALIKLLNPPKVTGIKAATLERSGLGLASGEQSLSQLRNSRPRTASLGSGKEFSGAQGVALQAGHVTSKVPDLRRSLPAHKTLQQSGDSPKLPRSQGISVLICPRSENGDDRREALKKLGLLRD